MVNENEQDGTRREDRTLETRVGKFTVKIPEDPVIVRSYVKPFVLDGTGATNATSNQESGELVVETGSAAYKPMGETVTLMDALLSASGRQPESIEHKHPGGIGITTTPHEVDHVPSLSRGMMWVEYHLSTWDLGDKIAPVNNRILAQVEGEDPREEVHKQTSEIRGKLQKKAAEMNTILAKHDLSLETDVADIKVILDGMNQLQADFKAALTIGNYGTIQGPFLEGIVVCDVSAHEYLRGIIVQESSENPGLYKPLTTQFAKEEYDILFRSPDPNFLNEPAKYVVERIADTQVLAYMLVLQSKYSKHDTQEAGLAETADTGHTRKRRGTEGADGATPEHVPSGQND